ncbi:hypothetical protein [Streptosporangium longisporum]|uniref:Uncharacterized protein n=1 Tax=Streptosporangium longisporum TaxID=46187 RepID=A0ABN3XTY6_9ACTN
MRQLETAILGLTAASPAPTAVVVALVAVVAVVPAVAVPAGADRPFMRRPR